MRELKDVLFDGGASDLQVNGETGMFRATTPRACEVCDGKEAQVIADCALERVKQWLRDRRVVQQHVATILGSIRRPDGHRGIAR